MLSNTYSNAQLLSYLLALNHLLLAHHLPQLLEKDRLSQ